MAFEVATGHPLFWTETSQNDGAIKLFKNITEIDIVTYLSDIRYSSEFKSFIADCLEKDPQKRASAQTLLEHDFLTAS